MTKECVNCGKANRDTAAICYSCGKAVSIKQEDRNKKSDNKIYENKDVADILKSLFGGK